MAVRALCFVLLALFVANISAASLRSRSLLETICEEACAAAGATNPSFFDGKMSGSELCDCICDSGTGERLYHASVPSKCLECVDKLKEKPYSCPKSVTDNKGNTAMHTAAKLCRLEMVDELVDDGFLVDSQNSAYDTPLCVAAEQSSDDCGQIVKRLITEGAKPCFKCSDGMTPFQRCKSKSVCDSLEQLGHDVCP